MDNNLLNKAKQMMLEQQHKIDSYPEYYTERELGVVQGMDRIIKMIERQVDFWVKAEDDNLPKIGQEVIIKYDYGDHTTLEKLFWSFEDLKYWKMNCIAFWKPCTNLERPAD